MEITLYSNNCPKCKILKQRLDEKNIKYTFCDDVDIMITKEFKTVPILEVNNKIFNYIEAINWVKEN